MDQSSWLLTRPIAHRGLFDARRPENSMAAFRHALSSDVPFELDVRLARDGLLVISHDRNLERTTGRRLAVAEADRTLLGQLRIGDSGEGIPLLPEVLEAINGEVPILLEVKHAAADASSELERRIASLISDYPSPLAVESFHPLSVFYLRRLVTDRPVGQISGTLDSANRVAATLGRAMASNLVCRPDFINFELAGLPARSVDFWRNRWNIPVITWTVRSPEDEERAKSLASNYLFDSYLPPAYWQPAPNRRGEST
ncbi:MAG TPA: glycerophosphodiester phosphodiesterase family protein [Streptosporangiaceae bacterium]|nr:glycerophosphodiester phosphodiesterase family protein [Streptosporangiaceae bacterium]